MNRGVICLIVSMLCLWPLSTSVGQPPTRADIQQVQARLKAVGLDPGPLDGYWAPRPRRRCERISSNGDYLYRANSMRRRSRCS